jgi:hypothetical protein
MGRFSTVDVEIEKSVSHLLGEINTKLLNRIIEIKKGDEFDISNPESMNLVIDLIESIRNLDLNDDIQLYDDVYVSDVINDIGDDDLQNELESRGYHVYDDEPVFEPKSWSEEQIFDKVYKLADNINHFDLMQTLDNIKVQSFGGAGNDKNQTSLF